MKKRRTDRALEHLLDHGCGAYHVEGSCEWQQRCDEPDCVRETTSGFPTPNGYRRTCGQHFIRAQMA